MQTRLLALTVTVLLLAAATTQGSTEFDAKIDDNHVEDRSNPDDVIAELAQELELENEEDNEEPAADDEQGDEPAAPEDEDDSPAEQKDTDEEPAADDEDVEEQESSGDEPAAPEDEDDEVQTDLEDGKYVNLVRRMKILNARHRSAHRALTIARRNLSSANRHSVRRWKNFQVARARYAAAQAACQKELNTRAKEAALVRELIQKVEKLHKVKGTELTTDLIESKSTESTESTKETSAISSDFAELLTELQTNRVHGSTKRIMKILLRLLAKLTVGKCAEKSIQLRRRVQAARRLARAARRLVRRQKRAYNRAQKRAAVTRQAVKDARRALSSTLFLRNRLRRLNRKIAALRRQNLQLVKNHAQFVKNHARIVKNHAQVVQRHAQVVRKHAQVVQKHAHCKRQNRKVVKSLARCKAASARKPTLGSSRSRTVPGSCSGLKKADPRLPSGRYWISTPKGKIQAYCDMTTDGGGWTLFTNINTVMHYGRWGPYTRPKLYGLASRSTTLLGEKPSGTIQRIRVEGTGWHVDMKTKRPTPDWRLNPCVEKSYNSDVVISTKGITQGGQPTYLRVQGGGIGHVYMGAKCISSTCKSKQLCIKNICPASHGAFGYLLTYGSYGPWQGAPRSSLGGFKTQCPRGANDVHYRCSGFEDKVNWKSVTMWYRTEPYTIPTEGVLARFEAGRGVLTQTCGGKKHVKQWTDLSGNNNHLTQANCQKGPQVGGKAYRVNGGGSVQPLRFDGSNDILANLQFRTTKRAVTVVGVFKLNTRSAGKYPWCLGDHVTNRAVMTFETQGGDAADVAYGWGNDKRFHIPRWSVNSAQQYRVFVVTASGSKTSARVYSSTGNALPMSANPSGAFPIFKRFSIGGLSFAMAHPEQNTAVDYLEFAVYGRALSQSEVTGIINGLSVKYKL